MGNPFEKPPVNKKEESTGRKNHFDLIRKEIEYKTGKKLPEDREELFRNFDELVPKEISDFSIADKTKPEDKHASLYRYSREGMKSRLERELYGETMEDVEDYFRNELESTEKELEKTQGSIDLGYKNDFDPKLLARHDRYVNLFNQISTGNLGNPLAEIELRIGSSFTAEAEKTNLRKFAERLSAEMYKSRPKASVDMGDIKKQIEEEAAYNNVEDEDVRKDNEEYFKSVLGSLEKGDLAPILKEIESRIGWIQERLEERKDKDLRNVSEEALKERFGENFIPAVNKELEKLRNYRKFLRSDQFKM